MDDSNLAQSGRSDLSILGWGSLLMTVTAAKAASHYQVDFLLLPDVHMRRIGDFPGDRSDRENHTASAVADDMTVIGIENTQVFARQKVSNSVNI